MIMYQLNLRASSTELSTVTIKIRTMTKNNAKMV